MKIEVETGQRMVMIRACLLSQVSLFADLEDAAHAARLQSELAPLRIVPSSEGLPRIAQLLRELLSSATGSVENR